MLIWGGFKSTIVGYIVLNGSVSNAEWNCWYVLESFDGRHRGLAFICQSCGLPVDEPM